MNVENHGTQTEPASFSTMQASAWKCAALMVAVTTFITTDIASAPFIWVVPLALFLLTFILVFKDKLDFNYNWLQLLFPASVLVLFICRGHVVGRGGKGG